MVINIINGNFKDECVNFSSKSIEKSLSAWLLVGMVLLLPVLTTSCSFSSKAERNNLNLKPLAASPNTFHTMNDFLGIMKRSRVEFQAMKSPERLANDITG